MPETPVITRYSPGDPIPDGHIVITFEKGDASHLVRNPYPMIPIIYDEDAMLDHDMMEAIEEATMESARARQLHDLLNALEDVWYTYSSTRTQGGMVKSRHAGNVSALVDARAELLKHGRIHENGMPTA